MSESGLSVSTWLERLKQGDEGAATLLWERYFRPLLALARKRLMPLQRRGAADEEDVALSAFHDFCREVRAERYADLHGRESLWRVLAVFVANKAKTLLDHEMAERRDVRRAQGESGLGSATGEAGPRGFDRLESREPAPAWLAEMKEKFERFFAGLSDEEAEIACLRMEGYGTEEIAARVRLAPATVRRRLAVIREVLAGEFSDAPAEPAGGA
jgi:DNA-directed RNA polymerase specialized sigma24 family protein